MKAKIEYKNGWQLIVPKDGFAPMLFLEWLATFRAGKNVVHRVTNSLYFLTIRLNETKEQIELAAKYINDNI